MKQGGGVLLVVAGVVLLVGGIKGTWRKVFNDLLGKSGGGLTPSPNGPGGYREQPGGPTLLPGEQYYPGGGAPPGFHICDHGPGTGGLRLCPDRNTGGGGCPPGYFLSSGHCVPNVGPENPTAAVNPLAQLTGVASGFASGLAPAGWPGSGVQTA